MPTEIDPRERPSAKSVRELRDMLGLTQEQLADRAGLERAEIAKIETGKNLATSAPIRAALARGFGLSLDVIFGLLDGKLSAKTALRRIHDRTGTDG